VAISMATAFKTSGFLYLKNHGIPPSVVAEVFASSAHFFARPQAQKDSLSWTTPQSNRGYNPPCREKLSQSSDVADIALLRDTIPDLKESIEMGREGVEGLPNRWPDNFDDKGKDFKRVMLGFSAKCKGLHILIMRAIAVGMDLPEHFFDEFTDEGDNTLRLLHYPAVSKDVFRNPEQARAGEHSDYGSITLLFQDSCGGLQVRSPKGTFVDAIPIPDTIVINAGDLLARWSNDIIQSTHHRVVQPLSCSDDETSNTYPPRYSVAFFCNPNFDKFIDVLPGTYGDEIGEKKYEGVNSGQYLIQRLEATLSY
jgi:isopenicillin N synthase-like dioxygenase